MKFKIRFVINPVSGSASHNSISEIIKDTIDKNKIHLDIHLTKQRGHASELAYDALKLGYDYVIAVGGDGTVNEIASALVGQSIGLGIIPCGSGNGLSRSLGIPMDIKKALKKINDLNAKYIDVGFVDDSPFFCTSGLGFDAHIGELFEKASGRGFQTYVKESLKSFFEYKPKKLRFKNIDFDRTEEVFVLTLANAGQYGNNAYISPEAKLDDGLLDLCILKPFTFISGLSLAYKLFNQTIHTSEFLEIIRVKELLVESDELIKYHLDGEFKFSNKKQIKFSIKPKSLKVLF